MHIPDGVLSPMTCVSSAVVSTAAIGYALHRVRREMNQRSVTRVGVLAACIFAAQMLNFPVSGGMSGHVLGGVLACVLLGPWAGTVAMSVVIFVQCLLFQDGGVTALGANLLNMAVLPCIGGHALYRAICDRVGGRRGVVVGAAVAAWCSVLAAAALASVQISLGGSISVIAALNAMLLTHSVIGIGESLITGWSLAFLVKVRPDLIPELGDASVARTHPILWAGMGLTIAIGLAAFVAPFASSWPDGLESSLAILGVPTVALPPIFTAPMADYQIAALDSLGLASVAAGAIGTLIVFLATLALVRTILEHFSSSVPRHQ